MDNQLAILNNQALADPLILKAITAKHEEISRLETPKNEIKKGFDKNDYVEVAYMERIANKEFPGYSFIIISERVHQVKGVDVAYTIHGRLIWMDCGVLRQGDMVASHQNAVVYLKKGKGKDATFILDENNNKIPTGYLSVSKAWKSAVTECSKKAFNKYMNIADDVYRKLDMSLTQNERTTLLKLLSKIDADWLEEEQGTTKQEMDDLILNGTINKSSLNLSTQKIEKWIRLCEADLADGWEAPK